YGRARFIRRRRRGAQECHHVHRAEQDQHEGNRKFHAQANPDRNDNVKKNDARAHGENGERVAYTPKCADHSRPAELTLASDNGGNGNYMVRVGSVAHTEKEADSNDGKKADHKTKYSNS